LENNLTINMKEIKDDLPLILDSDSGIGDATCVKILVLTSKGQLCTLITKLEGKDGVGHFTLIHEGSEKWTGIVLGEALERHSHNTVCVGFPASNPLRSLAEILSCDSEIGNGDSIDELESTSLTPIAKCTPEKLAKRYGSRRPRWIIPIAARMRPTGYAGKEKKTAASVENDLEFNCGSSHRDGTSPHHTVVQSQWIRFGFPLQITDISGQGIGLTGIGFIVTESTKELTVSQVRGHSQGIKRGDDALNRVIRFPLERFQVDGAIMTEDLGMSLQLDSGMRGVGS
jgi:hypothetical protein